MLAKEYYYMHCIIRWHVHVNMHVLCHIQTDVAFDVQKYYHHKIAVWLVKVKVSGKNQNVMRAQSINKPHSTVTCIANRIAEGTSGVCNAFGQQCGLQSTDCMMMLWNGGEKGEKWVLL